MLDVFSLLVCCTEMDGNSKTDFEAFFGAALLACFWYGKCCSAELSRDTRNMRWTLGGSGLCNPSLQHRQRLHYTVVS